MGNRVAGCVRAGGGRTGCRGSGKIRAQPCQNTHNATSLFRGAARKEAPAVSAAAMYHYFPLKGNEVALSN